MVRAHRQETGQPRSWVTHVAQQLGVNSETLRNWVNEADVEALNRSSTGLLARLIEGRTGMATVAPDRFEGRA